MNIKEFLSQARYLDMRIDSKISQVASLNDLATKCTSVITGMPSTPSRSKSTMADTVNKIVDLENEIRCDIDNLFKVKEDIMKVVNGVKKLEYRIILERRYLAFQNWENIAVELGYELSWLYKLHGKALQEADKVYRELEISD
ncbi:MAG: hypothetical protein K5768_08595 [Firmicutes bacterium]|nr:hypothetical protein [Bacillota bacterium]